MTHTAWCSETRWNGTLLYHYVSLSLRLIFSNVSLHWLTQNKTSDDTCLTTLGHEETNFIPSDAHLLPICFVVSRKLHHCAGASWDAVILDSRVIFLILNRVCVLFFLIYKRLYKDKIHFRYNFILHCSQLISVLNIHLDYMQIFYVRQTT